MKHLSIILGLFLILGTKYSRGQDTIFVTQSQIDSVQILINSHPQNNEEKVILLNKYAQLCFFNLNYLEGLKAMNEVRTISEKIKYKRGEALYHLTLAHFIKNNDYTLFNLLLHDWTLDSLIFRDIGIYENLLPLGIKVSDFEVIEQSLIEARSHFENVKEPEIIANIDLALFVNSRKENDSLQTDLYWEKAILQFQELKQPYPVFSLLLYKLNQSYEGNSTEEIKKYELKIIDLIESITDLRTKGLIYWQLGRFYHFGYGLNKHALEYFLNAYEIFEELDELVYYIPLWNMVGVGYMLLGEREKSIPIWDNLIETYNKLKDDGVAISEQVDNALAWVYTNYSGVKIGILSNKLDSIEVSKQNNSGTPIPSLNREDNTLAENIERELEEIKIYMNLAEEIINQLNIEFLKGRIYLLKARILDLQGKQYEAFKLNQKAYAIFLNDESQRWAPGVALAISRYYESMDDLEKALDYAIQSYNLKIKYKQPPYLASLQISKLYEKIGLANKALEYHKLYVEYESEFRKKFNGTTIADIEAKTVLETRKREIAALENEKLLAEKDKRNQRLWIFSISGALLSALLVSLILYRNNKQKQKTNTQLKRQKEKVEDTLKQLKATQSQLIQSEKMASLGELTAGIAHEIQNPLNFVNNFSEVSNELIEEVKSEKAKGKNERDEKLEDELLNDISQNLEKINHHGKRAEAIVKGMLQHSRTSAGQKELTDINKLADEYLRLSYHGLRAKDKSFNADFKTEFDESLPKINVVPQDIGRVLLNLINNAFYACAERSRSRSIVDKKAKEEEHPLPPKGGSEESARSFKPLVTLSTVSSKSPSGDSRLNDTVGQVGVKICVTDNGPGIPASIKDKIFQPFFTTKPTGSGTGLGLSLSYDIVKAHGGEITVESKENEGTVFIIEIPLKS